MTVHLIADREPYLSYAVQGDPHGSLFFCPGPDGAELLVLPAELALAPAPRGEEGGAPRFAYGPVSLMAACLEAGCADYLRDPWSIAELAARAGRLSRTRPREGKAVLELRGDCLELGGATKRRIALGEGDRRLFEILLRSGGEIVTRQAVAIGLLGKDRPGSRCIDARIARLRARLEALEPGLGRVIATCRGLGYRYQNELVDKL